MIPIFSKSDIKAYDLQLESQGLLDEAVARAGYLVYSFALRILGGSYGKKVVVLYGPGNNGRDALTAAQLLRSAGLRVSSIEYGSVEYFDPVSYREADLIVDGCFGIGITRPFKLPPIVPEAKVLAIDVPSGLDGDTGSIVGQAFSASWTLCLTGMKVGTLINEGPTHCGKVYFGELGYEHPENLETRDNLVVDCDLLSIRDFQNAKDHKWSHSLAVIAGSKGMSGAAYLVCKAAQVNGAGIVHLFTETPGASDKYPVETVTHFGELDSMGDQELVAFLSNLGSKFKALVIGPGLGRGEKVEQRVIGAISAHIPTVIDADGINSIPSAEWLKINVPVSHPGIVLTPHRGELESLVRRSSGMLLNDYTTQDIVTFARRFAEYTGVTILVKGGPTLIATPGGMSYITTAPSPALAIAGSGDVLSGMIGAALTLGGDFGKMTAMAAHLHGLAGRSLVRGSADELPKQARDIYLRLIATKAPNGRRKFEKATAIEGYLVAGNDLFMAR